MKYNEIRLLDKDIAAKIAAGEVVERPLSVVKELVENSIDAGADNITVEIKKGGKEYIRVSDNGCGIDGTQLEIAFKRHATSKIRTDDDLNYIESLGFRGEALASIAAVSKTELITKTASEKTGAYIKVYGGLTEETGQSAAEDGTSVIVRDLFYNTPARLKFLKADNTESSLIIDYISKIAIAYPAIRIRIISNDNVLFATQGNGSLKKAIQTVYGAAGDVNLLPVDYDLEDKHLYGYVSAPADSRNNRKYQIFYVNGRLVKNKTLEKALDIAYDDKLFDGRYPSCYLFLQTDPKDLDVNIHPHKTEIRFYDDDEILEFAVRGIRKALLNPDSGTRDKYINNQDQTITEPEIVPQLTGIPRVQKEKTDFIETNPNIVDVIKLPSTNSDSDYFENLRIKETEVQETIEADLYKVPDKLEFSKLTIVGQTFATYIILKDAEYVYFMDQHAAHERIMYEQLTESFNSENNASQILLVPIMIQLNPSEKTKALDRLDLLASLGFKIEEFGPSDFIVKEIPACIADSEVQDFIDSVLASDYPDIQLKKKEIITAACKSAVKANNDLAPSEISELLARLDKCINPYSCPHGRPTYLRFSEYELERMFKRK